MTPVEIAEAERTGAEQRERTDEEEEGKLLKLGFSGVRKQATEASSSKHLFDKEGKKEFLFFFQFFPQRIFKIHKALALLRLAPRAPRRKALASPRLFHSPRLTPADATARAPRASVRLGAPRARFFKLSTEQRIIYIITKRMHAKLASYERAI
uniref:Uncharacterized protein n=1 Tax=Opuntia streptacantha TaxID=393608 RepID=A0A7C9ADJ3_OPUST